MTLISFYCARGEENDSQSNAAAAREVDAIHKKGNDRFVCCVGSAKRDRRGTFGSAKNRFADDALMIAARRPITSQNSALMAAYRPDFLVVIAPSRYHPVPTKGRSTSARHSTRSAWREPIAPVGDCLEADSSEIEECFAPPRPPIAALFLE